MKNTLPKWKGILFINASPIFYRKWYLSDYLSIDCMLILLARYLLFRFKKIMLTLILTVGCLIGMWILFKSIDFFEKI